MLESVTLYRNSRSEASQIHVRMSRASKDFIHSFLGSPNPKKRIQVNKNLIAVRITKPSPQTEPHVS